MVAALLLAAVIAVGPNGHVLLPTLAPAEVRASLPVDAFLPMTSRLWVVYHEHPDWPMAVYLPAGEPSLYLVADGLERPLPGLQVPRLMLYAPYYRPPAPALELPLDVAQYLFGALAEALIDLAPPRGFDALAAAGGEAYGSAQVEFAAHALSVAVELRRSITRQRAAGKDPCAVVDHPATLFGLWRRVFTTLEYRGLRRVPGTSPARWVPGRPLTESDKTFFVERVLGGAWSGDPRRDFGLACPPGR